MPATAIVKHSQARAKRQLLPRPFPSLLREWHKQLKTKAPLAGTVVEWRSTSGWVKTQPAQTDCTWEPNLHACQSSCHAGKTNATSFGRLGPDFYLKLKVLSPQQLAGKGCTAKTVMIPPPTAAPVTCQISWVQNLGVGEAAGMGGTALPCPLAVD